MAKMVLLKCQNCDSKNEVKLHQQGSFGIEVAIWILTCFTLGWIYSIWRYMGKVAICPSCGKATKWA